MNQAQEHPRVKRTYDIPFDLYQWLESKANAERRAVIRQLETILVEARERDQQGA